MDDKPVKSRRFGKYVLSVCLDETALNPLEMGDPLFTMVAWDKDNHFRNSAASDMLPEEDRFDSLEDWESSVEDMRSVNFPYTYTDYGSGGVRVSLSMRSSVDNEYDGVFYVTVEDALRDKLDPLTADGRERLEKLLKSEIKELEAWLNGEVHGYVVNRICPHCDQEVKNAEPEDSCWGYYGEEDVAWDEGMSAVAHLLQEQRKGKHNGDTEATGNRCASTGADVRGGE